MADVVLMAEVRLAESVVVDDELRERLMRAIGVGLADALEDVDASALVRVAFGEKRTGPQLVDELRADQELRDAADRVARDG